MGDMIKCPSCCDQLFASKADLVQHLAPLQGDITCPVCTNKCPSLGHLIEHLTLDECSSIYELESYGLVEETQHNDFTSESMETFKPKLDLDGTKTEPDATIDTEDGKMYVEFLSKQQTRPYLQTQEVKLVKDNGVSRFVFVTQDDTDVDSESTIVTKQNNDGTISLTSVKDMPLESGSDTLITQESDAADNDEEIYSCNTCGVTFTSVLDHIQNYHNDQEVVVEEPMDEGVDSESVEWDAMSMESHTKEPPQNINERRMITDTGDIVQVPVLKTTSITLESLVLNNLNQSGSLLEQQIKKDPSPPNHTPYVGVVKSIKNSDQLEFAVVKNIKEPETKGGPYHKVVVKEMTAVTGQKTRIFQCISCNVHVTRLDDFKSKPCKTLRYQCAHCPVAYENSKSLCAHMKVHKEKGAEIISNAPSSYGCEVCLTVFTTNKSLKLHKRMHDPIKERPIEPPLVTAEGGEVSGDKYLCQVCHKLIPIDYRTIHQNSHKNIEKFNCDICNKKFSSKEYLVMHLGVHNMDKVTVCKQDESLPYLCVYCDRRFARPHEKVKHERIHTGEKPHSCEICGKSFRVSYCLTLHMRTHTGARPYACHHCGKRFKAHSVYNHHLLTHSDVRAYKCPYCPKAFKTSVQLAGHKNSHTKPFSCQYCNRPFASLYAVRIHTETHARQNNLKFSCTICGASYARAFALKDHVKQAHKEEDQVAEGNDGETILELT